MEKIILDQNQTCFGLPNEVPRDFPTFSCIVISCYHETCLSIHHPSHQKNLLSNCIVMTDIPRQLVSPLLSNNFPTYAFIINYAQTKLLVSFEGSAIASSHLLDN